MDVRTNVWSNKWMDEYMNGRINEWTNKWMDE